MATRAISLTIETKVVEWCKGKVNLGAAPSVSSFVSKTLQKAMEEEREELRNNARKHQRVKLGRKLS